MPHQNIQDIITVEKELQEKLDAERKKAAEWIKQQKEEIERTHQSLIEELQTVTCTKQEDVKTAATKQSEEIVSQALHYAQQFNELDDEILLPIVLQHIRRIDPRKT